MLSFSQGRLLHNGSVAQHSCVLSPPKCTLHVGKLVDSLGGNSQPLLFMTAHVWRSVSLSFYPSTKS